MHLTDAELLKAAEELDVAYARADEFDRAQREAWEKAHPERPEEEEGHDENAELRKAGLNHRGQP